MVPKGTVTLLTTNPKTRGKENVDFVVVANGPTCLMGTAKVQSMGLLTVHDERFINNVKSSNELGNLGVASLKTDPNVQPEVLPCRRIPPALQKTVKTELDTLVERGVLIPVDEPTKWVSQMAVVLKPSGKLRLCIDPQPLNQALK